MEIKRFAWHFQKILVIDLTLTIPSTLSNYSCISKTYRFFVFVCAIYVCKVREVKELLKIRRNFSMHLNEFMLNKNWKFDIYVDGTKEINYFIILLTVVKKLKINSTVSREKLNWFELNWFELNVLTLNSMNRTFTFLFLLRKTIYIRI